MAEREIDLTIHAGVSQKPTVYIGMAEFAFCLINSNAKRNH